MLKRTKHGWMVVSEAGKPLSKPNLSHEQAKERLRQVEFFKRQGKK